MTRKGRQNKHYEHTITVGDRCPRCNSSAYSILRIASTREHAGTTTSGIPYTHQITRRLRCDDCGQMRFQTELANHPADQPSDFAARPAESAGPTATNGKKP